MPSDSIPTSSLPIATITDAVLIDGSFSGIKRYEGKDRTVMRSIGRVSGGISMVLIPFTDDFCLEFCIGLSYFDSMTDVDGKGILTSILGGAGPLSDADNSRWFVRCCICVPLGFLKSAGVADNITQMGGVGNYRWGFSYIGAASGSEQINWWCEFDTPAKRRIRGLESPWLNLALECTSNIAPLAGRDVTTSVDSFQLRQVYAIS